MESLDKQNALRMITLFSGAVKGIAFYPASHPAIHQPMVELYKILTSAFSRADQIAWGLIDGIMFYDDHLFFEPSTAISDLTNRMLEKDVGRIIMTADVSFEEMQNFIRLFSNKGISFDVLATQLLQEGILHIHLVRQGAESFDEQDDQNDDVKDDRVGTYNKALAAIRSVCRDIERGRIPNSAPVLRIVDRMVSMTMQEPTTLMGLTMIKDYDNYTFNHCVNVGVLAMALGASLGLDADTVRDLGIAGQLHDIGKTMVPKEILNKPGKLSSDEFEQMKRHPELGSKIIREMKGLAPHIAQIVLGHHLHYNRSGYPQWARKLPFNQMVDIIATADTYDAITTLRCYQHPVNPKTALNEMRKLTGTVLDGALMGQFVEMMGDYPVGTVVRLDTNEVAVVYRPNPLENEAPVVRILIDENGERLPVPREQSLVDHDGSRYASIVAVVDPFLKNLDIGRLVSSGNFY
ncbi:MAG TPA: HD domain-containing protein [Desulfuromonadales bacterium]|nr:HD domain-containing protein [Desulfuromonadales bacterium]